MKTLTILTAALIGAVAFPTLTMAKDVGGCEIVDMGGYSNFVEPGCIPSTFVGSYGRTKTIDPDGIPANGDEFQVADQEKQDDLN